MPFARLPDAAGDYKKPFQFPIVKVGFTDNVASREANKNIEKLRAIGYTVIMEVPLHAKIPANISSGLKKLWSVGLSALARQQLRRKNGEWKGDNYDYYDYIK